MDINTNYTKTLGPKSAKFILSLYDDGKTIFTIDEASKYLNLEGQGLQKFLSPLIKKGILNRLITGLYSIVPFDLGNTTQFMGNPYVVAREVIRLKQKSTQPQYFISHASAFELLQMVTQPQMDIYATTNKQIKEKISIQGMRFHFVTIKKKDLFGFKKHWVSKSESILVSDLERTIIDGLKLPEYCGGITEVAKGLWIKRKELNTKKLIEYAEKIESGAVYRRLGYLLELYKMATEQELMSLQKQLTASYQILDPTQIDEGKYLAKWKLRLNISEAELLAILRT
jgi:predicted transcriptional regulator of viral defense system